MDNLRILPVIIMTGLAAVSCGIVSTREKQLRRYSPSASLVLPSSTDSMKSSGSIQEFYSAEGKSADTLTRVQFEGKDYIIMNAVRDEDGEMVATDVIDPIYVVASFKHVAERHGKVDLEFKMVIPEMLNYSKWQLRIFPKMVIDNNGETGLDPVIITGEQYRKAQLRGYQQYERFLSSIITDSSELLYKRQLELFIRRNMPELYCLKKDTSYVDDYEFRSRFGVFEKEAVNHYTNVIKSNINRFRSSRAPLVFKNKVKSPIVTEGIRLDTVIRNDSGDFEYNYIETIATRPKLRKVEIYLSGSVYDQDRKIYDIPQSEPISFYISSIAAFVDEREKYVEKIIERRVNVNTACYIEFEQNKSEVNEEFGNNPGEIARIKDNLRDIVSNEEFDLDSIVVVASSSPEGSYSRNKKLSDERSRSVSQYFKAFLQDEMWRIKAESGISVNLDAEFETDTSEANVNFISRSNPENWRTLDALVRSDGNIDQEEKNQYFDLASVEDPDSREKGVSRLKSYKYLRAFLYPRTRTVCFNFFLHRKGMVKDTVSTTVIDTAYMSAVQYIKDREYEKALSILRPYRDFNTVVALCAMDYNNSALELLEFMDISPKVNYLKALILSRLGDESSAVKRFVEACSEDNSLIHRGNLDPEISELIKKYNLNSFFNKL